jgi:hypothetical protein
MQNPVVTYLMTVFLNSVSVRAAPLVLFLNMEFFDAVAIFSSVGPDRGVIDGHRLYGQRQCSREPRCRTRF